MEYRIVLYDESNLIDIMNTHLKTKGEFKKNMESDIVQMISGWKLKFEWKNN